MKKTIIILLATVLHLIGSSRVVAAEKGSAPQVWLTGEVFAQDNVLFFRADKPIKGNSKGKVVLLGATKSTAGTILPMYMRAAEKHLKLRLFGALLPVSDSIPGYSKPLPSIQFITWKVHLPSDPDELPAGEKIQIR